MKNVSVNHQPGLTAQNELTEQNEFIQSTDQSLHVYVTGGGAGGGDVNITEVAGNPVTSGAGNTTSGTMRVVLADDQNPVQTLEQTGLVPLEYDYIAADYPDSVTETYEYFTGGSGGTQVATVTVIYTDPTKNELVSVART